MPSNQHTIDEDEMDDAEDLLKLLGNLDEYTNTETIQAVENVGRFSNVNCKYYFIININLYRK